MTEVYRPPQPRFSDEARVEVTKALLAAWRYLPGGATDADCTWLTSVALNEPAVAAEFDAACLSAYRSGRTEVARETVERLTAWATDAGGVTRPPDHKRLCTGDTHDDRWCSDCDRIEQGLEAAADLIEQWAKAEEEVVESGPSESSPTTSGETP